MRIVLKMLVGISLTWYACSRMDWSFGYLEIDQAFTLFLLLLAGSIMNMHKTSAVL